MDASYKPSYLNTLLCEGETISGAFRTMLLLKLSFCLLMRVFTEYLAFFCLNVEQTTCVNSDV